MREGGRRGPTLKKTSASTIRLAFWKRTPSVFTSNKKWGRGEQLLKNFVATKTNSSSNYFAGASRAIPSAHDL